MSMKQIADWALDTATQQGAAFADVRIVDHRQRTLATKSAKVGHAAGSESLGLGVRVLVDDAWGFASSDDLSRASIERTAGRAVEIARASAQVKEHPVRLAPEKPVKIEWATPCRVDPFSTSVEQNLDLLMRIDAELMSVPGITLAESMLNLGRYEQWFYSSEGSAIHQTRYSTGAGFTTFSFQGAEIQKRSY